jgi:hypothetical protein
MNHGCMGYVLILGIFDELCFHWYEHSFVVAGVTDGLSAIHVLKYASRYIDDLNVPNCTTEIEKTICSDIYPDDLEIHS